MAVMAVRNGSILDALNGTHSSGWGRLVTNLARIGSGLTIPAGVATWERKIMLERQLEGMPRPRKRANTGAARIDGLMRPGSKPRSRSLESLRRLPAV